MVAGRIEIPRNRVLLPALAFGLLVILQTALGGSAYPQASWGEFLKLLSYGLVFFLVSATVRSEQDENRLVGALLLVGFLAAFLGVLQYFTAGGKIYWSLFDPNWIPFGPYINKNHFAGLMEMTIPLALGLLLSGSLRAELRPLAAFLAVVMSASLILSGSRAGTLAFALEVICFIILISTIKRSPRWLPSVALILLLAGGMLYWLGLEPVLTRISTLGELRTEPSYQTRLVAYHDTWRMFRARPFFGSGFGTYGETFARYNSQVIEGRWHHAHNDYLELLAETGLFGAVAAALFLWLFLSKAFRNLQEAKSRSHRSLVLGALVGVFGILVHSIADYNLHTPANALIFFVLVAITQLPEPGTS